MGNEDNKFTIDSMTGKIYSKSLDRELQERYTLTVQASDNGIPSKKNRTNVIITVSAAPCNIILVDQVIVIHYILELSLPEPLQITLLLLLLG